MQFLLLLLYYQHLNVGKFYEDATFEQKVDKIVFL